MGNVCHMNKLLAYLNSLQKEDQIAFASRCETSVGYLRKAVSKGQKLGAELSVLIERESLNQVTRKDMHPDDWSLVWPELVDAA